MSYPYKDCIDREKVIKGLHNARRYLEDKEWSDRGASPHIDAINDALALMKEQEAVEPKHNQLSPTYWFCGKCGMRISRFHDYCPSCGQAVKWNE